MKEVKEKSSGLDKPQFPHIVYYLLAFSLLLLIALIMLSQNEKQLWAERNFFDRNSSELATKPTNQTFQANHSALVQHMFAQTLIDVNGSSANAERKNLPGALIVGVRGAGLELLWQVFQDHPLVKTVDKEIRFFEDAQIFNNGFHWYKDQMPSTKEGQLTIDVAPDCFADHIALKRLSLMLPNAKFVVAVREPTSRLIARYTRNLIVEQLPNTTAKFWSTEKDNRAFELCKEMAVGRYSFYYRRWLANFHRRQILFVPYERLIMDPTREIARVEKFLGINTNKNATEGAILRTKQVAEDIEKASSFKVKSSHSIALRRIYQTSRMHYNLFSMDLIKLTGDSFYKNWTY